MTDDRQDTVHTIPVS